MEKFRIEDASTVKIGKKTVVRFKAFEYIDEQDAYVFAGWHTAPQGTPSDKLADFIEFN